LEILVPKRDELAAGRKIKVIFSMPQRLLKEVDRQVKRRDGKPNRSAWVCEALATAVINGYGKQPEAGSDGW
jgi:metal-responsive CopG/Arc/MetJ family transcriptional regulator